MKSLVLYYLPWTEDQGYGFDDYSSLRIPGVGLIRGEVVEGDILEALEKANPRSKEILVNCVALDPESTK